MAKSKKTKTHKSSAGRIKNRALNAFDLAGNDVDNRAQRRLGRATLDQAEAGSGDEDQVDYLSGEVKSEDDEEIDSDAAFPSDDDFDYDEFMTGTSSAGKKEKKPRALTLDESSDQEEDANEESDASIDESEMVSLSAAWDLDEKDKNEVSSVKPTEGVELELDDNDSELADSSSSESGAEEDDENEDEDDDDIFSDLSEDEEINEDQLLSLRSQIADLSDKKAQREDLHAKRRLEINTLTEGEFSVPVSKKLSLADLTGTAGGTAQTSLTLLPSLIKNTRLNEHGTERPAQALNIPLPKRIQDRYDRSAAFEVAKDEVDKWTETVQQNRQADHLQFPMNKVTPITKQTASTPLEPTTDLEKKVNGLLVESSLKNEKDLTNFEDLAPSKLSMEEVKKRRNELRMMRELLFREEQKAKRIKKIKSKSYRRVHKKEREKLKSLIEGEEDELDNEGRDMARARERMSLKHKNTGKWAKRMVDQGFTKDKETRSEMEEMLRRGETLRKKIMGDEGASDDDDGEYSDEGSAAEGFSDPEEAATVKSKLEKGIMGMSFIKQAQEKKREENDQERELLRRAEEEDGWEELQDDSDNGANQIINEGRMKFGPGTAASKNVARQVMDEIRAEIDEESTLSSRMDNKFGKQVVKQTAGKQNNKTKMRRKEIGEEDIEIHFTSEFKESSMKEIEQKDEAGDDDDESNPWLTVSDHPKKKSSKTGIVAHSNNTKSEKQALRAKKLRAKGKTGVAENDALIDMNQTLSIVDPYGSGEEHNSDLAEGDDMVSVSKTKKLSFKQKDLVKRAFAGDDVVTEFQEEKRARIQEDGDKEIDITLPGWGSWGGDGLTPTKRVIKKVAGIKEADRKDAKLKNVIINEKINKKNAKYNSSSVPFPYENREQYERSLRTPIGQEWSSKNTFQQLTKPRVLVKSGTVIDPLKAPFK